MLIEKDKEDPSQIIERSCGYAGITKPVIKFVESEKNDQSNL